MKNILDLVISGLIENLFDETFEANLPLARTVNLTLQVPDDRVSILPFFSLQEPETVQIFAPFELVEPTREVEYLEDGSRADNFQVTTGVVAAPTDGIHVEETNSPKAKKLIIMRLNFITRALLKNLLIDMLGGHHKEYRSGATHLTSCIHSLHGPSKNHIGRLTKSQRLDPSKVCAQFHNMSNRPYLCT